MKSKAKGLLMTVFTALSLAVAFYGCKKDDYVEIEGVCPVVISTYPINGATGVPLDTIITVTFNEEMNPGTMTQSAFTLMGGGTKVNGTLTYNNTNATMSFAPDNNLTANTTYTGTVTTEVKDLSGNALQKDYVWSFSTGITVKPIVVATDPANNATGVFLNKQITATFNMSMDPSTLNASTFTLKNGAQTVPGTVTYSGTTATFSPAVNLLSGTVYTARISNAVTNVAGTHMDSDYVWTFATGLVIAPIVISTDPANNATGVALNKVITATFNMPMDPLTLNATTFTVKRGSTPVAGTITYSGTTASFTPSANLVSGTVYTATITTGAKNPAGTPTANNYTWTFTTIGSPAPFVIATDPINNATGVPLNKTISATFNIGMDPATLNNSTFTLQQGTTPVSGTVTYSGSTAYFKPTTNLIAGKLYTATITTGAKNASGTAMAQNYVWTFTTATVVAPIVVSTDPFNNETNVALNKVIRATFSLPMDPATINNTTFTVKNGSTPVAGTVTYTGYTASFTPASNLLPGVTYTATITTGAKNTAGTSLASNYVWSFTTTGPIAPMVISTDPANNATGVPFNKVVRATFNIAMDPTTINNTTFTLTQAGTPVAGTVTYSGTTASFTPTSNLTSGTIYTATITTGAKSTAGTPMAQNYVWTFTTQAPTGAPFVNLKSAANFGIIAGVGISNNAGFSVINNMNVGISPGVRSSITGFPPATVVNGNIYASDDIAPPGVAAMLIQAKQDLADAYDFAAGATTPAPATVSGDQGGKTLAPGIYKSNSTLLIQGGNLTLDAQGDANAVWIFQIASGFTTVGGAGGSVILTGGAQAKNVFWQTGSSATIGDNTSFQGTVLALTSITMNSMATATGRMLARNGSVVLTNTNIINKP